jgi:hypothetical protein
MISEFKQTHLYNYIDLYYIVLMTSDDSHILAHL